MYRRLDPDRTLLLVVDMQERFQPAIDRFEEVVAAASTLLQGAEIFDLPVIFSEQYPRGLGPTVEELAGHLARSTRLEKVAFSAVDADGFDLGGRDQVLLCGVEAHVCVYQSALDLLRRGAEVLVVGDAVSSRKPADRHLGVRRMEAEGARVTGVEMALFELLGRAGLDEFKAVQRLIR